MPRARVQGPSCKVIIISCSCTLSLPSPLPLQVPKPCRRHRHTQPHTHTYPWCSAAVSTNSSQAKCLCTSLTVSLVWHHEPPARPRSAPRQNTSPIKPRDRCSQPRCCAILRSRPTPHSQSPQLPSATTGSRTPSLNPTVLLHAAPRPGYPDMHATVHNLKPRVPGAPCRRRRCVAVHRWWRIFPAAVPRLKALLNVRPRRAAR